MMRPLIAGITVLLTFSVACGAETNSPPFLVATNKLDFKHFTEMNLERSQKGLKIIPIQVSAELNEMLVSDGTSPPSNKQQCGFSFNNAPLPYVLDYYTKLTGKKVLIDNGLSAAITVKPEGNVSVTDAIKLIELALATKGIELIPADEKTLKAIRTLKKARGAQPSARGNGIPSPQP